jgi:hypothetical protein
VVIAGQVFGIWAGKRSSRALEGQIRETSLDPSEVKTLREWAVRVSEFLFRTNGNEAQILELRKQIAPLLILVPQLDERMTAVERELDAKLDRLEQRVISQLQASERRVGEMAERSGEQTVELVGKAVREITDWLGTLKASGIRGFTPPEGSLLDQRKEQ